MIGSQMSSTLVEEVQSFTRQSSCRVLSCWCKQSPFPHTVDLDSDQELSLTLIGSGKENLEKLVNHKIDFDYGDSSDDEFGIRKSSPLFKDQQKEADLVTAPTFPIIARKTCSPVNTPARQLVLQLVRATRTRYWLWESTWILTRATMLRWSQLGLHVRR